MFGNVKFIAELGNLDLLNEAILHKCMRTLLEKRKDERYADMSDDLECLCKMMPTVGAKFDHGEALKLMDQYFERMRKLQANKEMGARIRFLMQDVIEMRSNGWRARRSQLDNAPKTMNEVRNGPLAVAIDEAKPTVASVPAPFYMKPAEYGSYGIYTQHKPMRDKLNSSSSSSTSSLNGRHVTPAGVGIVGVGGKKALTDREEMDMKPPVDQAMIKTHVVKKRIAAPASQSPPPVPQATVPLPASMGQVSNGEIVPLNKPVIAIEKIIQVRQSHVNGTGAVSKCHSGKEETQKRLGAMLAEYAASGDAKAARETLKGFKMSHEGMSEMVRYLIVHTLAKEDADRLALSKLFGELHQAALLPPDAFMSGLSAIFETFSELELEYHFVKSQVALYAARAVCDGVLNLCELASLMKNGAFYPLFFLCMQQMHRVKTPEWLRGQLDKSKMSLIEMLPDGDRTKERLIQVLEDRELAFLNPMLKIESALLTKVQAGVSADELREWIGSVVGEELTLTSAFVHSLVTCVVKNACEASCVANEEHMGDKVAMRQQKDALQRYQSILHEHLSGNLARQVEAIYAMQLYAESRAFMPKNLLAILFHQMYDLETIDEDAFIMWKDEVNDNYPNKGKALFHLQKWFNWLQEASEESDA